VKKGILIFLIFFSLFLSHVQSANIQDVGRSWPDVIRKSSTSLSGLESSDYKRVKVVVNFRETGSPFGEAFKERIRTRCDLRLRQAGLEPVSQKNTGEYLRVGLGILSRTMAIDLDFMRLVAFSAEEKIYLAEASTWEAGTFGTHGGKEESLLSSLDGRLDSFLKEYLKANSKRE
jgi:hypothetical protein